MSSQTGNVCWKKYFQKRSSLTLAISDKVVTHLKFKIIEPVKLDIKLVQKQKRKHMHEYENLGTIWNRKTDRQ